MGRREKIARVEHCVMAIHPISMFAINPKIMSAHTHDLNVKVENLTRKGAASWGGNKIGQQWCWPYHGN